jgi:hypothetical protein
MSLLLLLGGGGGPTEQTGDFALDAVIRKEQTGSFSINAVVLKTQQASHGLDAVIKKEQTASFGTDAIVLKTQTGSLSVDAVILKAIESSAGLDAIIKKEIAGSFGADAIVKKEATGSLSLDAYIVAVQSGSFGADAYILAVQSASFGADAVIFKEQAGSFALDAVIFKTIAGSFGLDSVLVKTIEATFALDAIVLKEATGSGALDAVIFKTQAGSGTLDAWIVTVGATTQTGTFGLDAEIINPPGTHDRRTAHFGTQPDYTITSLDPLGPLPAGTTLDVVLDWLYDNMGEFYPQFGLNAVVQGEQVGLFGLDAYIGRTFTGSFGLNALVEALPIFQFGLDAVIHSPSEPWNLVRTPVGSGAATYTAISELGVSGYVAAAAADGMVYHDSSGDAWRKGGSGVGAIGDWWQVTWGVPQTVNRVVVYDGGYQSVGTFANGRFGNTGNITFSDGSSIPYTGLNDTFLTFDFAPRTVTWIRITSTTAGGSACGLAEVEAYNTDQWED